MFIWKETRLRGPAYPDSTPYTAPDGTQYPRTPRELLQEIADPVPPADFSDETYYRTEQDGAPYVVYTRKADEVIAQAEQAKANTKAIAYLASTDWYVTRHAEVGTAIPEDVLAKRKEARNAIVTASPAVPISSPL